jgi:uncharacterized RDD family membrane protein YckC
MAMTDRAPEVSWQPPPEEEGPSPGIPFASLGARLVAYIVDGIILSVVFIVAFFILSFALVAGSGVDVSDPENPRISPAAIGGLTLFMLLFIIVTIAYFPFFWARGGQTPGMKPFGIRVVRDRDGGPVTAGQAILRLIGMWVAAAVFYIGFIWVFIDSRRRGWHDLVAGTVVVQKP